MFVDGGLTGWFMYVYVVLLYWVFLVSAQSPDTLQVALDLAVPLHPRIQA